MGILYHYTSIDALVRIVGGIQNGKLFLRAGNAKNMNDPNDCYYFINMLEKLKNIDKSKLDEIVKEKDRYDSPYIVSLSSHKDDLHMWTCYGDNGKGVAIGFENLDNAASKFFKEKKISTHIYECQYWNENDIKSNSNLSSIIAETTNFGKEFWTRKEISDISNIIKHPCYKYEDESRIVITHGDKEPSCGVSKISKDAIFMDVPLSQVKRIIVGPCADYDVIKKVFSQNFKDAEFIKSTIPYRSK